MSPWWLVIFAAVFLIGVTKSGFGSGVGLMIVPMTALSLGHLPHWQFKDALGLLLPLLILGDLLAVWQYRHLFSLSIVKKLLPGTAVGVLLGGAVLWLFDQQKELAAALIQIEIGFESVVLVGLHWWRISRGMALHVSPTALRSNVVGGAAGASSTLAHAAGPIIALYLLPQGLERQLFVGTCAIYFGMLNLAKVPVYIKLGQFRPDLLHLSGWMLPIVVAGAMFGLWLNRRMKDAGFSRIVYCITFVLGWYVLIEGTVGLMKWKHG
jgi:uncharacterized membrane protein YfcA